MRRDTIYAIGTFILLVMLALLICISIDQNFIHNNSRKLQGPQIEDSSVKNEEIDDVSISSLLPANKSLPALPVNFTDNNNLFDTVGQTYKITAYTAGPESTGKYPGDPGYGITCCGKEVQENHTIAADLSLLPLGTKVLIEGIDAVFTVEDCGGAVKGNHIDIYIPKLNNALDWGVQYRRVIILEKGTSR